jgi:hypothetical protein
MTRLRSSDERSQDGTSAFISRAVSFESASGSEEPIVSVPARLWWGTDKPGLPGAETTESRSGVSAPGHCRKCGCDLTDSVSGVPPPLDRHLDDGPKYAAGGWETGGRSGGVARVVGSCSGPRETAGEWDRGHSGHRSKGLFVRMLYQPVSEAGLPSLRLTPTRPDPRNAGMQ